MKALHEWGFADDLWADILSFVFLHTLSSYFRGRAHTTPVSSSRLNTPLYRMNPDTKIQR